MPPCPPPLPLFPYTTLFRSVKLVRGDMNAFGLQGRSAEQRIALDVLADPSVGIVSIGGRAGTGKSALALCAGLEAVLERQEHRKIVVFRPMYRSEERRVGKGCRCTRARD